MAEKVALIDPFDNPGFSPAQASATPVSASSQGLVDPFDKPNYSPPPPSEIELSGGQPSVLARTGRGFMDVAQGIKQLGLMVADPIQGVMEGPGYEPQAPGYTADVNAEIAQYEKDLGDDASFMPAGVDLPRVSGQIAATAPAMLGGSGALGRSAIEGVAAGSSTFSPGGTFAEKGMQAGLGGAAGVAGNLAVRGAVAGGGALTNAVAKYASKAKGSVDAMRVGSIEDVLRPAMAEMQIDFDSLGADVQRHLITLAQKQLRSGGGIDPAVAARKADFDALGLQPTQAQITRDPQMWAREQNLSKIDGVGDDLLSRFRSQNARLNEVVDGFRDQVSGGRVSDAYDTGAQAVGSMQRKAQVGQRLVGRRYTEAANAPGANEPLPTAMLREELSSRSLEKDGILEIYEDIIPAPVLNRLKEIANPDSDRPFTVSQAERLKKLMNQRMQSSPDLRRARKEINTALDNAIGQMSPDNVAVEASRTARAEASKRFAEIKPFADIIDGKTAPEDFVRKHVLSAKIDDLSKLKSFVTTGSKRQQAEGGQLWEDMRGQVVEHLHSAATSGKGADGRFSGDSLKRALAKIGDRRLAVIFSPDELAKLKQISRVSFDATYTPPFSGVNHSNTTPALANLVSQASRAPLVGQAIKHAQDVGQDIGGRRGVAEALDASVVRPRVNDALRARQRALADALSARASVPAAALVVQEQ